MSGRGNICSLKDDFEWLKGKMLDADGIIFTVPIFEKGAAGIFRTVVDRFGPRMDRGNNVVAKKLPKKMVELHQMKETSKIKLSLILE